MKYAMKLIVLAAFAASLPFGIQYVHSRAKVALAQSRTSPPPFTGYAVEHISGPAGTWDSDQKVYAVRTDGSEVELHQYVMQDGRSYQTRTVNSTNGKVATINDTFRFVSTLQFPPDREQARQTAKLDPASDCVKNFNGGPRRVAKVIGHEKLLGIDTVKVQLEQAGGMVLWLAPSLGCFMMKRSMSFRGPDNSVTDTSELTVTRVLLGEPDASLFQNPAPPGYEELAPSEAAKRFKMLFHPSDHRYSSDEIDKRDAATGVQQILRRRDKEYEQYRPK
jgi:hypothetical protein